MKNFSEPPRYVVISASRMTEMPAFYPELIISETEARRAKGMTVHTLVLWTKHPASLLREPLVSYLKSLASGGSQIYVQLTITGMGGLAQLCDESGKPLCDNTGRPFMMERKSPTTAEAVAAIPSVIEVAGNADRIRLRFDPIVRIADARGTVYSNASLMPAVIEKVRAQGVRNFTFSFLEKGVHAKVDRRIEAAGCHIVPFTFTERAEFGDLFRSYENKFDVAIKACCVQGFDDSSCIDGAFLSEIHDGRAHAGLKELRRRPKCGCTESIDIGGWPPRKCPNGCIYCYSNPVFQS